MTFVIAVLMVLLATVTIIAVEAWRIARQSTFADSDLETIQRLCARPSRFHRAEPLFRLSDPSARQRRLIGLHLRALRAEFANAWNLCRFLAPLTDDPGFSVRLLRNLVVFHGLYCVVHADLLLRRGSSTAQLSALMATAASMQTSAQSLLTLAEAVPSAG